ncbi:uncharacterized protein I303_103402 [Kwoniella dejecticola CBS 10117]|uniref:RRM domain-containing protein n=1 Tax=Kwoniella dejecticola CBS 10117 TaxID=1296121 RepID=A0A1A6A6N1_9TREE|nr:uncharacterized protein I303_03425 [Kwoniella dejecticola CBS 10117]OBR85714.1 hypothetical protein I303_03425 [Kwoniella dejecticola CBS 10117]
MVEAVINPIKQATESVVAAANDFVAGKPSTTEEDEKKIADIPKEDDGHRVYIGNLSYATTEEQVREFVAPVGGEIKSVQLPTKFGKRPAGYAFVTYTNGTDANKAVDQLKDKELDGRQVKLELARPAEKVLEIRKQKDEQRKERREAANAKKAEKAAESAKAAGVPTNGDAKPAEGEEKPKKKKASKPKAKKSRRRVPGEGEDGEAEAEGEASADADAAKPASKGRIDVNGGAAEGEVKEKKKRAPRPARERQPRLELTGDDSKNTIFVANLPFSVNDESLATIFTNLSIKVKSAKVVQGIRKPRAGAARTFKPFRASKGFGFVELENEAEQNEAVEKVDGTLIEDRKITAKIAKEMKPIEQEQVADAQA